MAQLIVCVFYVSFFTCLLAKFGWSIVRQLLGRSWCPTIFPQFFAIFSIFAGGSLHSALVDLCYPMLETMKCGQ
jgi:hypothetical protein